MKQILHTIKLVLYSPAFLFWWLMDNDPLDDAFQEYEKLRAKRAASNLNKSDSDTVQP